MIIISGDIKKTKICEVSLMHHIEVDVTKSCKSRKKQQLLKNRIKGRCQKS